MNKFNIPLGDYQSVERPWLWVSIFFILGLVAANNFKLPFFILYILSFILLVAAFLSLNNKKIFFLSLLFLIVSFGFLRFQIADILPEDNIGNYATTEKQHLMLEGFIVKDPVVTKDKYERERLDFIFEVNFLIKNDKRLKASGNVKTTIYGRDFKDFEYGKAYILEGNLFKPKEPSGDNKFNYGEYLRRKNIYALFYVTKNDGVLKLNQDKANPILRVAYNLKNNLKKKYDLLLPYPYNGLLSAFILGDRENIPKSLNDSFIHTGCVHILAISGLHVGIVIFIILALFKMLRLKRKPSALLSIIFLIFYCFLTGARVSVLRASIMASIILLGWLLNRDSDLYNSLGLSAFLIVLFNPYQIFDIGFQLSFVAVLSIVYLTPKIENLFKSLFKSTNNTSPLIFKTKIANYIFKGCCASFCACLGIMPLTLYYFNLASNMTIISNLFILPLLTIALALGFLVSIVSFIWLELAKIFSQSLWLILFLMVKITELLEKVPFAYFEYKDFTFPLLVLYYLLLIIVFNYRSLKRKFNL